MAPTAVETPKRVRSFIVYFGGDYRHIPFIMSILPKGHTLIEAFGGSGVVTLNAVARNKYRRYILNDRSEHIYSMYRWFRSASDSDVRRIARRLGFVNRNLHNEGFRERFKKWAVKVLLSRSPSPEDLIIIYNSGQPKWANGTGTFSYLMKKSSVFHDYGRLRLARDLLRKVIIMNSDGVRLIRRFDRPGVVFYLDPPFVDVVEKSSGSFYDSLGVDGVRRLASALRSLRSASFVLKLSRDEWERYYRRLLRGLPVKVYHYRYKSSIGSRGEREYVFVVFDRSRNG